MFTQIVLEKDISAEAGLMGRIEEFKISEFKMTAFFTKALNIPRQGN